MGSFIEKASHHAFRGAGRILGLTAVGAAHGGRGALGLMASGGYHGVKDYLGWRGRAAKQLSADAAAAGGSSFFKRTAGGHLAKGGANLMKYTFLSPLSMGLHMAFAGFMSNDNLMDVHNGLATTIASNVASEVGFTLGGAAGSALAAMALPGVGIAAAVGFLAGGFKGGELGAKAVDGLIGMAEFGMKNGRHGRPFRGTFVDSEHAATMRQRAMNSIYRSQMNARSAFGNEALAYHS